MKLRIGTVIALGAAAALMVPWQSAQAQDAGHAHIGHVRSGFPATPGGEGLLPTAQAEAATAARHAGLAANDDTNLQWMQTHARHVLHAVDPSRVEEGPGLGFGVKQAAEGISRHIGLAADTEGASENVGTHANHVATAADAVADRADRIAELAGQVEAAGDYSTAGELIRQIRTLTGQLTAGADLDGDGQVSWQGGEGGLDHVEQHMNLLARGEGLN